MSLRILLADDHELVRAGLRSLLDKQPGMEVIGEAKDGREAVRAARDLAPDVVVMDLDMPKHRGNAPDRRRPARGEPSMVVAGWGARAASRAEGVPMTSLVQSLRIDEGFGPRARAQRVRPHRIPYGLPAEPRERSDRGEGGSPYGIRTRVTGVRGRRPRPLDERATCPG